MSDGVTITGYPEGRTRRTLEALAGRGDLIPDLDIEFDETTWLLGWHQEIRKSCGNSGFGALPVTPSMISDWQAMTGDYIRPEFCAIIIDMDVAYRDGMAETSAYFEKRNK